MTLFPTEKKTTGGVLDKLLTAFSCPEVQLVDTHAYTDDVLVQQSRTEIRAFFLDLYLHNLERLIIILENKCVLIYGALLFQASAEAIHYIRPTLLLSNFFPFHSSDQWPHSRQSLFRPLTKVPSVLSQECRIFCLYACCHGGP